MCVNVYRYICYYMFDTRYYIYICYYMLLRDYMCIYSCVNINSHTISCKCGNLSRPHEMPSFGTPPSTCENHSFHSFIRA